MAPPLDQILLAPDVQPHVVADCLTLIDQEVSGKSGISGAAVKLAYKTAKTFAKGYLQSTVENLLPDFVAALEPYWADFAASGAAGFGDYLVKRGDEVISTRGPGDYVGEIALLQDVPRTATVVTKTPATIEVIGRREFSTLLADEPEIAAAIKETAAERVKELEGKGS